MSLIDLSSFLGLTGYIILTLNFLFGLLLSTGYRKSIIFRKLPARLKAFPMLSLHNITAYIAIFFLMVHPLLLLGDRALKMDLKAIALPMASPHQPLWVAFGIFSFYALIVVIISSQKKLKRAMGFRSWKNIHFISFFTLIAAGLHGIFMDPLLKDGEPDFMDGEKLICELSLLVVLVSIIIRVRYHFKNMKAQG